MSTNHNRIKVADLETNQPNKILKTNQNGELEFSDANNLQTENYNGLDYTEEGKALDARQGKVLKDMMDNEYMKLSGNQTFSGVKTATNTSYPQNAGLIIRDTSASGNTKNIILSSNSGTGLFCDNTGGTGIFSQTTSGYAGHFYCNGNGKALYVHSLNSSDRTATIIGNTNNDNLYITNKGAGANVKSISTGTGLVFAGNNGYGNTSTINKDGDIKAKSIELAAGTIQNPSLTIPNGSLTSEPRDGAIERDENGQLWETHSGIRTKIATEETAITLLNKSCGAGADSSSDTSGCYEVVVSNLSKGQITNDLFSKINQSLAYTRYVYSQNNPPSSLKIDTYIKIVNGTFDGYVYGSNPVGQYLLFDTFNLLDAPVNSRYIHNCSKTLQSWVTNDGAPGNACGIGIDDVFYNTRNLDNSERLLPSDCQFQVVQKIVWEYEDAENITGLNQLIRIITRVNAFWIEKIF